MIEALVTGGVAAIAGGWAVINGIHKKLGSFDTRLDRMELHLAKDYISRAEYHSDQNKLEEHMIRIENKLDVFIQEFSKR